MEDVLPCCKVVYPRASTRKQHILLSHHERWIAVARTTTKAHTLGGLHLTTYGPVSSCTGGEDDAGTLCDHSTWDATEAITHATTTPSPLGEDSVRRVRPRPAELISRLSSVGRRSGTSCCTEQFQTEGAQSVFESNAAASSVGPTWTTNARSDCVHDVRISSLQCFSDRDEIHATILKSFARVEVPHVRSCCS